MMYRIIKSSDLDIYIPVSKRTISDYTAVGTIIFAFRGTDTLTQGLISANLLVDYATHYNPAYHQAYQAHILNVDEKYNHIDSYFTNATYTNMNKIFVGHSYGGAVALALTKRFKQDYPEQFANYNVAFDEVVNQATPYSKFNWLSCYTINPMFIHDSNFVDLENECRNSLTYKLGIINNISRGDLVSAPFITKGIGRCYISENPVSDTAVEYGWLMPQWIAYWQATQEEIATRWLDYTHTYENHKLGAYLGGDYEIVPLLLPSIDPDSPLLLQDENLVVNHHMETAKHFYKETSQVYPDGVPLELYTHTQYNPPNDLMSAGNILTRLNPATELGGYNFGLRRAENIVFGEEYYHIFDIDEYRYHVHYTGIVEPINHQDTQYIRREYGVNARVKYFTVPLEMVNMLNPDPTYHTINTMFLLNKYHNPDNKEYFIGHISNKNSLTFFLAPAGDYFANYHADLNVQTKQNMLTTLRGNMSLTTELERTWRLEAPLVHSDRRDHLELIPPNHILDVFGISGKTDFNTHIVTKSGYNFVSEQFSAASFYVIDDDATANDFYAIGSLSTVGNWGYDGPQAMSPDTEVWNISYDEANSSWNITNTSTSRRLFYATAASNPHYYANNSYDFTSLVTGDFPLTNQNIQIVNNNDGFFQMYITIRGVKRYFSMMQNTYSSENYYGYLVLVDEDKLTTDFTATTMFAIADNVPTNSGIVE